MKTFLTIITFLTLPLLGSSQTLCSKYTTALFVNNTADDQLELISTLVNLAVLGDETLDVDGILAPGGNLASFFDGSTATANRGGVATAVNFLDGAPDLPTPSMTSNTYILLVHLYQFFGALIGCDAEGFPAYQGVADMYEGKFEGHLYIYKYLDLLSYFYSLIFFHYYPSNQCTSSCSSTRLRTITSSDKWGQLPWPWVSLKKMRPPWVEFWTASLIVAVLLR